MDGLVQSYRNRLLELLDPKDLDRLRPHLKPATFDYRESLYEASSPISSVYFPIDGVASLVNTMALPIFFWRPSCTDQRLHSGARFWITSASRRTEFRN